MTAREQWIGMMMEEDGLDSFRAFHVQSDRVMDGMEEITAVRIMGYRIVDIGDDGMTNDGDGG